MTDESLPAYRDPRGGSPVALPFLLRRDHDVMGVVVVTSTREVAHGILRIEVDRLVVQLTIAERALRVAERRQQPPAMTRHASRPASL